MINNNDIEYNNITLKKEENKQLKNIIEELYEIGYYD